MKQFSFVNWKLLKLQNGIFSTMILYNIIFCRWWFLIYYAYQKKTSKRLMKLLICRDKYCEFKRFWGIEDMFNIGGWMGLGFESLFSIKKFKATFQEHFVSFIRLKTNNCSAIKIPIGCLKGNRILKLNKS